MNCEVCGSQLERQYSCFAFLLPKKGGDHHGKIKIKGSVERVSFTIDVVELDFATNTSEVFFAGKKQKSLQIGSDRRISSIGTICLGQQNVCPQAGCVYVIDYNVIINSDLTFSEVFLSKNFILKDSKTGIEYNYMGNDSKYPSTQVKKIVSNSTSPPITYRKYIPIKLSPNNHQQALERIKTLINFS